MYKFEICWTESVSGVNFPITHYKGFKSRENYEKFLKRLEKKGAKIVARIEEFKLVK